MHTLRVPLIGAAVLGLLAGLSGVAVAESETGPVHVTGTIGGSQTESGSLAFADESIQYRGSTFV